MASSIKLMLIHEGRVYAGKVRGPCLSLVHDRDPGWSILRTQVDLQGHPTQTLKGLVKVGVEMYIGAERVTTYWLSVWDAEIRRGDESHLLIARTRAVDLTDFFGSPDAA